MKVMLIYPELGFSDSFIKNPPLSLVYVACDIAKMKDLEIEIIDCRVESSWKEHIREALRNDKVVYAGISVMSGIPVKYAFEISYLIKSFSSIPVVWGGPHPTILPEEVLKSDKIDFCIRGFGIKPLKELTEQLISRKNDFHNIPGLCFRNEKEIVINDINCEFEIYRYHDIPYYLIEKYMVRYLGQQKERVFPVYTAAGCPYKCAFCIAPIWYKKNKKKWIPYEVTEVVDHIEFLKKKYDLTMVYFIDDDSFVSISHFRAIAKEIVKRGIDIKIGIRGMRVNEINKATDGDLMLLKKIGVKYIHIGVESGSDTILSVMKKGITANDSIKANKKLARFPDLIPIYNILVGIPTEKITDLYKTKDLMIQLSKDNKQGIILYPGKYIPYPGSELYELAKSHGFSQPQTFGDWYQLDQEKEIYFPWYTKKFNNYIRMLYVCSFILSNWEEFIRGYIFYFRFLFVLIKRLYKPIGMLRLRFNISACLVEYYIFVFLKKILQTIRKTVDLQE